MQAEYFQGAKTHFITGKGGVGKTTVAIILAFAEALKGKRVLILDFAPTQGAASLFGLSESSGYPHPVAEGIDVALATSESALKEYVLQAIRFESVYTMFFENRWVKHFLRLMPSLAELVLLGKIWFHSKGEEDKAYDVIIVDLPATGHALSMLQTPAILESMVPVGPMKSKALEIKAWLEDHEKTQLHVVTTPEELSITEALKIIESCQNPLRMKLGQCVINQMHVHVDSEILGKLENQKESTPQLLKILQSYCKEIEHREKELQRLPEQIRKSALRLPWWGKVQWTSEDFQHLAQGINFYA